MDAFYFRRLLKNNRGRRSLCLKLEVDEGIADSLGKYDGEGHESPYRCRNQAGARSRRFQNCYRAATNARQ